MKTIECTKSILCESLLHLDGRPFSLEGRELLRPIYDLEENDVLLMFGRQFGKSTTIGSKALMECVTKPFFKILYVTPRMDQTSEFSKKKLVPFLNTRYKFGQLYTDASCDKSVWNKSLTTGSQIIMRYAYLSADAVRGVTADMVCLDEIQDIILGNISVLEECYAGSPYQWRMYSGTPKTYNNTLAQKWVQSTQNEYVYQCLGCKKWNYIEIKNIGKNGLICKNCGKDFLYEDVSYHGLPMRVIRNPGQWVAKRSLNDPGIYLAGFRVPQIVSPMVKWEKLLEKYETYPTSRFMNEVMAMPWDNSANPITEEDLRKCCDSNRKNEFKIPDHYRALPRFLGVDWGHGDSSLSAKKGHPTGFTQVTLGCIDHDGSFLEFGKKKFSGLESDPMHQVQFIANLARSLSIDVVGVDFGGGFLHNKMLREHYHPDRILEWQASDNLRVGIRFTPEVDRLVFNRTECMTDRFIEIKKGKLKTFNWQEFSEFATDYLTIFVDYRGDGRTMFYGHTVPDDAFHSYMICKLTADYVINHRGL